MAGIILLVLYYVFCYAVTVAVTPKDVTKREGITGAQILKQFDKSNREAERLPPGVIDFDAIAFGLILCKACGKTHHAQYFCRTRHRLECPRCGECDSAVLRPLARDEIKNILDNEPETMV